MRPACRASLAAILKKQLIAPLYALVLGISSLLLYGCAAKCPCSAKHPANAQPTAAASGAPTAAVAPTSAVKQWDHSQAKVPVSPQDPAWGEPDAPVTVVVFTDLQCPFCGRVEPTLDQIRQTYGPKKVRIVHLHAPLPFHEHAYPAALAATTVQALGGSAAFYRFIGLVFQNQRDLSDENLANWAVASGVSAAAFREGLANPRNKDKVEADKALAKRLGVTGTPAFRINGTTLVGAQPYEKFAEVIDQQIAEAAKLVAAGTRASDVYVSLANRNAELVPLQPERPSKPPAEDDNTVWQVPVLADDPVLGNATAPVTIVVFSDFECPFCRRVEATLKQLREHYKNDLRIVWKDNPLPFHPQAGPAAALGRLVLARRGNAAFWTIHDRLFDAEPKLTREVLTKLAEEYRIPWHDVESAVEKGRIKERLEASQDLASDLEARGTPHFFINGIRLSGAQPYEHFVGRIDAELSRAKALLARGVPGARLYQELIKDGKGPTKPERKTAPMPAASRPSIGPANAAVLIQMWSDFQCPFCKRVEETLEALRKEFPRELRVVWRHMPLPFHAQAPLAAEVAEEVLAEKGNAAFWTFHDRAFAAQAEADGLSAENLERLAIGLGVDPVRLQAALHDHRHRATLEADTSIAESIDIQGTPAFVINGYFISGAQPLAAFRKVVKLALSDKAAGRK